MKKKIKLQIEVEKEAIFCDSFGKKLYFQRRNKKCVI